MHAIATRLRHPHEAYRSSEVRTVRDRQYTRAEVRIWVRRACIRGRRIQNRVFSRSERITTTFVYICSGRSRSARVKQSLIGWESTEGADTFRSIRRFSTTTMHRAKSIGSSLSLKVYGFVSMTIATASLIGLTCVCSSAVCWVRPDGGCEDQLFDVNSGGWWGTSHGSIVTLRGEVSTLGSSGNAKRVWDVSFCNRDVFQLLNEIGDAGDSRGTIASVSSSIGALPVVANAEESGVLAETGIRDRELDEEGSGAGVLADSGNGSFRWQVGGSGRESGLQTRKTRLQNSQRRLASLRF